MAKKTRARGGKLAVRRLEAAGMYLHGLSYEQIADVSGVSVPTVSRDVNAGLQMIRERQRQELDTQRTIALARYERMLAEEDGLTAASRRNRVSIQARIDKITGVDRVLPVERGKAADLAERLAEVFDALE